MSDVLRFIGITKDARTAGPGKRLELFTKGCIRGVVSPCEGCFNQITWSFEGEYKEFTVDELIELINRDAWNRQVTFCGGEPILQAKNLALVAKKLKEIDSTFHFVMYTMYKLDVLMKYGLKFTWVKDKHEEAMLHQLLDYASQYTIKERDEFKRPIRVNMTLLTPEEVKEVMRHIDYIVDGEYKHELRLTTAEFMHDGGFIGSSNQRVIFASETMQLSNGDKLLYIPSDQYMEQYAQHSHCKACGHIVKHHEFCNHLCEKRFNKREEKMKALV